MAQISAALRQPRAGSGGCGRSAFHRRGESSFFGGNLSTPRPIKRTLTDQFASAVRFVVEELPAAVLPGAYLLVAEARFGVEEIRHLYQSAEYPLRRAV